MHEYYYNLSMEFEQRLQTMETHLHPFTWAGVVNSQHTDHQATFTAEVLHCRSTYGIVLHFNVGCLHMYVHEHIQESKDVRKLINNTHLVAASTSVGYCFAIHSPPV